MVVDAVAEEGEVAFEGVVGEDAGELGCELPCRRHRGGAAVEESHIAGFGEHVGVERHDERALVDEVAPESQIDGRAVPHHPTQEHADPLARRAGILRHHPHRPVLGKPAAYSLHRRKRIMHPERPQPLAHATTG